VLLTGGTGIVQVHPTRRCNLRCAHCYSQSGPQVTDTTDPELLGAALHDAAALGYQVVSVSGGEPLLFRGLRDLLAAAKRAGMRTSVTTNGMSLTRRRLAELDGVLDTVAVSLDGRPETHTAIRRNAAAFDVLHARLPELRRSTIPFGFICTLTMANVAELEFVVGYARKQGARFVQVHPLEPEGAALINLAGEVPDSRELSFAVFEAARLAAAHDIPVQLDVVRRTEVAARPNLFCGGPETPDAPLASWLSPVVVETDGTVVPLTYGFPRRFALGSLTERPFAALAADWHPEAFLALCRDTAARLRDPGPQLVNWYAELLATAREPVR